MHGRSPRLLRPLCPGATLGDKEVTTNESVVQAHLPESRCIVMISAIGSCSWTAFEGGGGEGRAVTTRRTRLASGAVTSTWSGLGRSPPLGAALWRWGRAR
jgi:hypothetical protein